MPTPRGIFTVPVNVGSGEQGLVAASVPTLAGCALVSVQGASVIWTDQPTASGALTASTNDIAAAPADGPFTVMNPGSFRWRDVGAAGFITFSFYEGSGWVGADVLGL